MKHDRRRHRGTQDLLPNKMKKRKRQIKTVLVVHSTGGDSISPANDLVFEHRPVEPCVLKQRSRFALTGSGACFPFYRLRCIRFSLFLFYPSFSLISSPSALACSRQDNSRQRHSIGRHTASLASPSVCRRHWSRGSAAGHNLLSEMACALRIQPENAI